MKHNKRGRKSLWASPVKSVKKTINECDERKERVDCLGEGGINMDNAKSGLYSLIKQARDKAAMKIGKKEKK